MLHRFIALLLVFSILGQASIRTAWTLYYQSNRAIYITQCVNKDKPSLHCDGQCAFMKQMAAYAKKGPQEPRLPENFRDIKDIQLFFFEGYTLSVILTGKTDKALILPPYRRYLPDAPRSGIFRPPIA
ncbi:MAG: hypothetical protein ACKVT2_18160 [Saprospiraceae bacterium]